MVRGKTNRPPARKLLCLFLGSSVGPGLPLMTGGGLGLVDQNALLPPSVSGSHSVLCFRRFQFCQEKSYSVLDEIEKRFWRFSSLFIVKSICIFNIHSHCSFGIWSETTLIYLQLWLFWVLYSKGINHVENWKQTLFTKCISALRHFPPLFSHLLYTPTN